MQRSALCRSRRELSNEYLLAKFGFDTAENEPCKVCPLSAYRSIIIIGSRPEKQRAASYFSDLIVAGIFLVCLAFSLAFDGSEHGSAEII